MAEKEYLVAPRTYLDLFSNLSQVIAQTPDLSGLTKAAVHVIQSVLSVESCSIMLLDLEEKRLTMQASSTIPEEMWPRIAVDLGEGIAGTVAETGEPVCSNGGKDKAKSTPASTSGRTYRTQSYICVPLLTAQSIIGVINVTDRVDGTDFSGFDVEMLNSIAKMVAVAINNNRLWASAQKSHDHLSMVIEELPIGMLTINTAGLLTLCNRAAKSFLNLPPSILVDKPWADIFEEPVRSHIEAIVKQMEQGRTAYIDEFEIPGESPEATRAVRVSAVMAEYLASLKTRHIFFFIEDLQQMKELVELRRSDQMKSNFLSLISHELRTPLASIKGAIHLLNQMSVDDLRGSADRIFTVLHRNSDRLTHLVNNILDAMDIESNSLRLYRKRTDLRAMLERVLKKMQSAEMDKTVVWDIDVESAPDGVYVDESRLGQVVEHLLENALKFTPQDGTISVKSSTTDSNWVFQVTNTGRPIDASLHEKVFSRFYQVDGTLTRYYGGSGLGLYLCREIVRLHGGDIRIDPAFGDGVCFCVTVPQVTELV